MFQRDALGNVGVSLSEIADNTEIDLSARSIIVNSGNLIAATIVKSTDGIQITRSANGVLTGSCCNKLKPLFSSGATDVSARIAFIGNGRRSFHASCNFVSHFVLEYDIIYKNKQGVKS